MKKNLIEKAARLNIEISGETADKFELYFMRLIEANKKFNLTNITEADEAVDKHFIDSLVALPLIKRGCAVCDVGSGAGFPALALALMLPENSFVLMDSLNKRVEFLLDTAARLGLKNVACLHVRAEDAGRAAAHREGYDRVLARAVAPLNTLCEYCLPLTAAGGEFLAYKTDSEEELRRAQNAICVLGGRLKDIYKITLPGTDINRSVRIIEKIKPTPEKYPRGKNKEREKPL
jgi:16S rRNA (guanine527-N7)-methyltransferase